MVDKQGLQNTYMALGQMDEAIKMHLEDAEREEREQVAHNLRHVSSALCSAQTSLRVILKDLNAS